MLLSDLSRHPGISYLQKSRINRTLRFDETILAKAALFGSVFALVQSCDELKGPWTPERGSKSFVQGLG